MGRLAVRRTANETLSAMPDLFPDFAAFKIIFLLLPLLAILWALLPFAVFGVKKRLDEQIRISKQLLASQQALYEHLKNNETTAAPFGKTP